MRSEAGVRRPTATQATVDDARTTRARQPTTDDDGESTGRPTLPRGQGDRVLASTVRLKSGEGVRSRINWTQSCEGRRRRGRVRPGQRHGSKSGPPFLPPCRSPSKPSLEARRSAQNPLRPRARQRHGIREERRPVASARSKGEQPPSRPSLSRPLSHSPARPLLASQRPADRRRARRNAAAPGQLGRGARRQSGRGRSARP